MFNGNGTAAETRTYFQGNTPSSALLGVNMVRAAQASPDHGFCSAGVRRSSSVGCPPRAKCALGVESAMCYRVQPGATVQNDIDWKQRVAKEEARIDRPPSAMPDPFKHSLSTRLSQAALSEPSRAQPQQKAGRGGGAGVTTGGGSRPASQLSAGGRSRASAAPSRASAPPSRASAAGSRGAQGRSAMGSAMGSAAPAAPPLRAASQISVTSWFELQPPRSPEPTPERSRR